MPRPRLQTSSPALSPGQATYVLERLMADRRISAGEISRYVADMHREISSLEERLNSLRSAAGAASAPEAAPRRRPGRPPGGGAGAATAAGAPRGRRRGRPPASASAAAPASSGSADAAPAGGAKRGRKRRTAITAEQLASRQLQGRYLGLIRQIPATRRGSYQKIAKDQGREAAIKELARALGK